MFCAMLGTVAGNLALTLGARGGIYIAGGIVPKLGEAFAPRSSAPASRTRAACARTSRRSRPSSSQDPTPLCSVPPNYSILRSRPRAGATHHSTI